jgi:hypothetical protein
MATLSPTTRRRLEIQGFVDVEERTLAETAPWLRLALALCTVMAAAGTALGSPMVLWSLVPIAALAAAQIAAASLASFLPDNLAGRTDFGATSASHPSQRST